MSHAHPTPASSPNFQLILNNALKAYEKHTKCDLLAHPLAAQLQACESSSAILTIIRQQVQGLNQSQRADDRMTKWLNPTINVLYAFSATLGAGVGLVFSPTQVIFAGVGVLLSAAMDVRASHDTLIDIFERIENFFQRLEIYTEVAPTPEMIDIIIKIIVEVLSILGIATKQIKQGRTKKYLKKLVGRTDIEDALKKLDKLTNEEARMATAQGLKATHTVDDRVRGVDDKVLDVNNKVAAVDHRVAGVDERVAGVDERVAGVDERVAAVDNKVASVDNRVEDVQVRVASVDDKVKTVDDKVAVIINEGKQAKVVIQQTAIDIDEVKRNQLRQELPKWLSPPDPSINHNIACGAHHKRNAEWFFQGSIFTEWKSTGSLLWLYGKPGSGKSILCSTIIQDIISLRDSGLASMAYFYFDFRDADKQSRRDLLSSLVTQLSSRSDHCFDTLIRLYLAHDKGAQKPGEDALMQCLKQMLAVHDEDPVYIIIDALDECPDTSGMPSPREQVLDLLKELVELSLPNLHLCVTSRPEIDIRQALEPLTSRRVSLHGQNGQKKDIVDYVTLVVQSDPKMRRWRDEDRNLVIETLSERADGMFRWVFCQLEVLRYCFPPSVRQMLEELPETQDETYQRILRDINKANRDHAHRLLQCLTAAVRPLRVTELAEVLAVDFEMTTCGGTSKLNPDWRWEDQQHAVLSTCSSLISIVDENGSQVVQFSHFSVKEFLMSPRLAESSANVSRFHILLEPAHTILAKACLGVLLQFDEQVDGDNVEKSFPLARYAAEHWVDHAKFDQVSSRVREEMEDLFDPDKPHFNAWLRVHKIDVDHDGLPLYEFSRRSSSPFSPLYCAVLCRFHDLAEHLIMKYPQQVNAEGGYYVSPLGAALGREHFDIAQLLYEHGADVDVRGRGQRTALYAVSLHGNRQFVEWLVSHGADVNFQCYYDVSTPLHIAASHGWVEISQILLQRNADGNALNRYGQTPLHLASEQGYINIAQLLIEHGVDVNAQDNYCSTALHLALKQGSIGVVQFLLEHGADVNARDNNRSTTLHLASKQGHIDVAQFLLEFVDVNARDNNRLTALHLASEHGHVDIARLLLKHGVDVNAWSKNRSTALHLASEHGHVDIARLLLKHGVDVNAWGKNRFTALHLASERGHVDVARLLLKHGVDVNAWGKKHSTALHLASRKSKLEVVCLLLEHGADVEAQDLRRRTPLQVALGEQRDEIRKLLSERHVGLLNHA